MLVDYLCRVRIILTIRWDITNKVQCVVDAHGCSYFTELYLGIFTVNVEQSLSYCTIFLAGLGSSYRDLNASMIA